jgi:uncharacterized membrane protein YphA (DoxX/SURF4 family)
LGSHIFIFVVRCMLATIWFYDGLWLKILAGDRHYTALKILGNPFPRLYPVESIRAVGWAETLLAVIILSGLFHRVASWTQFLILLFLGFIGLSLETIQDPVGWIIANLPLATCIMFVAFYGPGGFAISFRNISNLRKRK